MLNRTNIDTCLTDRISKSQFPIDCVAGWNTGLRLVISIQIFISWTFSDTWSTRIMTKIERFRRTSCYTMFRHVVSPCIWRTIDKPNTFLSIIVGKPLIWTNFDTSMSVWIPICFFRNRALRNTFSCVIISKTSGTIGGACSCRILCPIALRTKQYAITG